MKRILSLVLIFVVLLYSVPNSYCATSRNDVDHDEILKKVLTGGAMSNNATEAMEMLCAASSLCADQCNGNGTSDLELLRKYGVKRLPSIEEINFKVFGGNHRTKTHGGWNYPYSDDETQDEEWAKKWIVRKNILLATTNKVFNFGIVTNISGIFGIYDSESKCSAFSQFLYYIHILGDYYGDDEVQGSSPATMGDLMPFALVSPNDDNPDILYELERIFAILFDDQVNSSEYIKLINQIDALRTEVHNVDPTGTHYGDSSYYTMYQGFARELLNKILSDESTSSLESNTVAYLLSQETFFSKVFW